MFVQLILLVVGIFATACSGGEPRKGTSPRVPTNLQNITDSDPHTYRVLCPPSVCEVDLFRRSCYPSKEHICPTPYNSKASVCCFTGCCEPRGSALKEFFGKFWLIVAIVFGIVLTSATSIWLRRSQRWNRGFSLRRRQQLTAIESSGVEVDPPVPMVRSPDHPPTYDDALGFPKPDDGLDCLSNPPAYSDVNFSLVMPGDTSVGVDSATGTMSASDTDLGIPTARTDAAGVCTSSSQHQEAQALAIHHSEPHASMENVTALDQSVLPQTSTVTMNEPSQHQSLRSTHSSQSTQSTQSDNFTDTRPLV